MKNNNYLYYGLGALSLCGIIFFATKKQKNNTGIVIDENQIVNETIPLPPIINKELLLQRGSKGLEVSELQKLMGISPDGVFGIQTETILQKLKGITSTTLNHFNNTPTINTNYLSVGTNIMADVKPNTPIFNAIKKADDTHYSDYKIIDRISYGQKIGKIIGSNATKTWYLVQIEGLFTSKIVFVKAAEVAKI